MPVDRVEYRRGSTTVARIFNGGMDCRIAYPPAPRASSCDCGGSCFHTTATSLWIAALHVLTASK